MGGKWKLADYVCKAQGFNDVTAIPDAQSFGSGSIDASPSTPALRPTHSRCLLSFCVTLNSIIGHNGMNNYDLCICIHSLRPFSVFGVYDFAVDYLLN